MVTNAVNASDIDFQQVSGAMRRSDQQFDHPRFTENLGITLSAGTFSVTSADGSALGNDNPGYITLSSKASPGTLIRQTITSDQSFEDANGTSDIIGNLFGFTTSVATTEDIPFWLYVVTDDNDANPVFMISRMPHFTISPVAAEIGTPASAIADEQYSFFAFSSITVTDYDSNPCLPLGIFRMRMDASDDWTVQTLGTRDGIGNWGEEIAWRQPPGQFGAVAGSYARANGGTAPAFSSVDSRYWVRRTGAITYVLNMFGDGGTDGAGTVSAQVAPPYVGRANQYYVARWQAAGGNIRSGYLHKTGGSPTAQQLDLGADNIAAPGDVQWAAFTNGDREISCMGTFSPLDQ